MSRPARDELLKALAAAFAGVGASLASRVRRARRESLYEVYVAGLLVGSAQAAGAKPEVRDGSDKPSKVLTLRRKPGRICGDPKFGFVLLAGPNRYMELHTDIQVIGRSGTRHEIDVALLGRQRCVKARAASADPARAGLRLLAECKFYSSPLPLHTGREFAGLIAEMRPTKPALVTSAGTGGTDDLVQFVGGRTFPGLVPKAAAAESVFRAWADAAMAAIL
ncbi:MAG: hypothetical protein IT460_04065 [Planctomycetes bacterium]|nr:hypothetical protein [Planctomycetota bacterium]